MMKPESRDVHTTTAFFTATLACRHAGHTTIEMEETMASSRVTGAGSATAGDRTMLHVRSIMSSRVTTVSPDLGLREAIALLIEQHVSGAPVVAGGRIVGVVSATDILEFADATPAVPALQPDQVEAEWEEPEAWVEGEAPPSTYFSEWWSDAGADVAERGERSASPEWDILADHTVAEVMTRHLCVVRPDATVSAAADYMLRAGVHRVLVVDGGKLLGILTTTDYVRAVAQGLLRAAPSAPARRNARVRVGSHRSGSHR
jgi:CBS domain-containing protein